MPGPWNMIRGLGCAGGFIPQVSSSVNNDSRHKCVLLGLVVDESDYHGLEVFQFGGVLVGCFGSVLDVTTHRYVHDKPVVWHWEIQGTSKTRRTPRHKPTSQGTIEDNNMYVDPRRIFIKRIYLIAKYNLM